MGPAPNHNSGPGVPRTNRHIPITPFLQRPATFSSSPQPTPPLAGSAHPLPLRVQPFPWEGIPHSVAPAQQRPELPRPPSIYYRRGRHLQLYPVHRVPAPTLASIGVDRQDTSEFWGSLDSVLNAQHSPEQRTARPLLPTPCSGSWPPYPPTPLTSFNDTWGTNSDVETSTSGSSFGSSEPSTSLRTPFVHSPVGRRNALAQIRSPIMPASTDTEHEAQANHISTGEEPVEPVAFSLKAEDHVNVETR